TVLGSIVVDGSVEADEINVPGSGVTYDNAVSGLDADNVQDAIDDIVQQAGVFSYNGRVGVGTPEAGDYDKDMVGLGNVDNTADLDKPISTATQAELTSLQDAVTLLEDEKAGIDDGETISGAWNFT